MHANIKQTLFPAPVASAVPIRRPLALGVAALAVATIVACSSPGQLGPATGPVPAKPQPGSSVARTVPPAAHSDSTAGMPPAVPPPPSPSTAPAASPTVPTDPPLAAVDPGVPAVQTTKHPAEVGLASWYGRPFHGRRTASGERYDMHAYTAAHKTLPLSSHVRVRNPRNGKAVIVRVNDRGPFIKGRTIDLSRAAARAVGIHGVGRVEIERLSQEDLQSGRLSPGPVVAVAAEAKVLHDKPDHRGGPAGASSVTSGALKASTLVGASTHIDNADEKLSHAAGKRTGGYWLQLGAFKERESAERFMQDVMRQVRPLSPLLAVMGDARVYRLQAGPFADKEVARVAAGRVQTKMSVQPLIFLRR